MTKVKFEISGMSCSACAKHIEDKVNKIESVTASVNLLQNTMVAQFDENKVCVDDIISAVESVGYGASIHTDAEKTNKKVLDIKLIQLIASVLLLVPLMIVGMGHMYSLHINSAISAVIQIILCGIIIALNFKYFTNGFKGLIKLSPNMDTLIALGATASVVYSIIAIFTLEHYIHNLYFESAGMILTFVSVGKYFESRSKAKTTQAISKLMDLSPDTTTVRRDGKEIEIPTDEVVVDDIVIIKSGDRISVDGVVISGNGYADESALTGESMPVKKTSNAEVFCGTTLSSGYIEVKAQKVKGDTTLSKIIALVEEAAASKAPIAKIADVVSKFFVPTIIAISIITTLVWNMTQNDFATALSFGIAVLVISCPCALGLATPTAIMVATGVAAQNSILIKSSQALEVMSKVKNIVFDKTGTITLGKPTVNDIELFADISKTELLKITASIERMSSHPLSHAVIASYGSDDYYDVSNFESITSKGIKGTINGTTYKIGNKEFASDSDTGNNDEGYTQLYVSNENKLLGVISVSDKIKESSKYAIEKLNEMGIQTYMLTGDNESSANFVQSQTGVKHVYAKLMPDDKEKIVSNIKESGVTVMVGDGINDSPALVSADVGIAIGAGTDIAIDSADVILTRSDLTDVLTAIELSKSTLKNIKQNLFWAFIYNIIFIPIACGLFYNTLGIRLEPMYGTIAMSLSSICVVSNALRLKLFKPKYIYKEQKSNMKTMIIDGMMCMHCKAHVEKALNAIDGVSATVDLESKSATISGDVSDEVLTKAVTDAGYTVISIK